MPGEITARSRSGRMGSARLGATPLTGSGDVLDALGIERLAAASPDVSRRLGRVLGLVRDAPDEGRRTGRQGLARGGRGQRGADRAGARATSSLGPTVSTELCDDAVYDRRVEKPYWLDEQAEYMDARRHDGPVDVAIVGGGVWAAPVRSRWPRPEGGFACTKRARSPPARAGGTAAFAFVVARCSTTSPERCSRPERAAAFWRLTERTLDRMAELAGDAFERVGGLRLAANEQGRAAGGTRRVARGRLRRGVGRRVARATRRQATAAIVNPDDGALFPGDGCGVWRPGPSRRERMSVRGRGSRHSTTSMQARRDRL